MLSDALVGLANKMEPQAAVEIAKDLAAVLENSQETNSNRLSNLGQSLAALCMLLPSTHRTHLLALSNMLLRPVSKEVAEGEKQPNDRKLLAEVSAQLSRQDLAELLKYPFCTGEVEQIVLDQLKTKTQRGLWPGCVEIRGTGRFTGHQGYKQSGTAAFGQDALKELEGLQVRSGSADGQ